MIENVKDNNWKSEQVENVLKYINRKANKFQILIRFLKAYYGNKILLISMFE